MKTVQFGTFLQNLAQRVGLDISGEQYKDLISANLQIPEDVANKIFAGTLTVDAAVNNPEVRKRLIPELLNPVDKELLALAKEIGIDDNDLSEIGQSKETRGKIGLLQEKLKAVIEKKSTTTNKVEKDTLQKQVDELHLQIKKMKQDNENEVSQLKSSHENELVDLTLSTKLFGKEYGFPEGTPIEDQIAFAALSLKNALAENKYKLVRDGKTIKVIKEDGTDAYDTNQNKVVLDDFINSTLANKNLLKVKTGKETDITDPVIINTNPTNKVSQVGLNMVKEAMSDLQLGSV